MTLAVNIATTSVEPDAEAYMLPELNSYGGVYGMSCYMYVCGGFMDPNALYALEDLPSVASITPARIKRKAPARNIFSTEAPTDEPTKKPPRCDDTAVCCAQNSTSEVPIVTGSRVALQVPKILEQYPELDGRGLKVGIISDTFNYLGGMDKNIECGYLPPRSDIEVFADEGKGKDEGRGMAQVIYASAKNVKIAFSGTGDGSSAGFVDAIQNLVDAGVDVIADDLGTTESWFQWGPVATKANEVAKELGIPYFSAIGNNGMGAWAGGPYKAGPCPDWVPDGSAISCHEFENGKNFQKIVALWEEYQEGPFEFQFASPSKSSGPVGSTSNLDVFVYFDDKYQPDDSSSEDNILTGDPFEKFQAKGGEVRIAIGLVEGTEPSYMKWTIDNVDRSRYGDVEPPLNGSQQDCQGNAPYVASIGAANDGQLFSSLQLQGYSSTGGTQPILYDADGMPQDPKIYNKPNLVGPHGSQTSFFGEETPEFTGATTLFPYEGSLFYGTSCATPNAATLALLFLQIDRSLTPTEIYRHLERTAIDMEDPGFDYNTGYGYVNGLRAVSELMEKTSKSSKTSKSTKLAKKNKADGSDRLEYCKFTDYPTNT